LLAPQISPALAPAHSALVPWQSPRWQMPWKQMLPAPYCASAVHWASVLQPPQVFGWVTPQSWPPGQSADEPWQSPVTQPPEMHTVEPPYDPSALQARSLPQALQVWVGPSQILPPVQSEERRHSPATQTLLMQRCWGPYAVTHPESLLHATHEWVPASQSCPPPQSVVVWQVPETQAPPTQRWFVP
jgi:hypothetical protein